MKKVLLLLTAFLCTNVFANDTQTQGTSSATTNSVAAASNQGNSQAITFTTPPVTSQTITSSGNENVSQNITGNQTQNVNYSGSQTIRNVPSVSGPNLVSSNDTCMGSSSGSANGPGFGISVGSTWTDLACVRIKSARELWNMGMKAAALSLMCNDKEMHNALTVTGFICPQDVSSSQLSSDKKLDINQSTTYTGNDPIIRARMGLSAN